MKIKTRDSILSQSKCLLPWKQTLVRMWGKKGTSVLLEGVQTCTVVMEKIRVQPFQNAKAGTTL